MSFEDRVAAVGIATQFQERCNEVFRMVNEETETAKTQVSSNELRKKGPH
jgi:magnesium chelatase subunit D